MTDNSACGMDKEARAPRVLAVCVTVCAVMLCRDLVDAWWTGPLERGGALAFAVWSLPLWWTLASGARPAPSCLWTCGAAVLAALGAVMQVNAVQHLGLLASVAAWTSVRSPLRRWLWACSGAGWLPAFGWLAGIAAGGPWSITLLRLALVGLGLAVLGWRVGARASEDGEPLSDATGPAASRGCVSWGAATAVSAVALLAALAWMMAPLPGGEERLLALPIRGASFSSQGVALAAAERRAVGLALTCRRLYTLDDCQVLVSIVDGTRNRHVVHDPIYCIAGDGWRVVASEDRPLPGGAARLLRFERSGRGGELLYWFSDGQQKHASTLGYWCQSTLRRLTWGWSGAEPLLVIVQSHGERPVDWDRVLAPDGPLAGF